jgi:alkanesulfonate monooxygenase SsuD/methylene tetrahydromethanopterin reductase-like flavin-dependent oxidoreductase (luciferase family)
MVFQEFATLDLLSQGRVEMVVGRGSFIEAFPLFGLRLDEYDSLFSEKLELLLRIRENEHVHWSGKHRPALTGQGIYPRPLQEPMPIWIGVGGTPESFVRAGLLGLPLMVAIIGGETRSFKPLIDLYMEAGKRAGHSSHQLKVKYYWNYTGFKDEMYLVSKYSKYITKRQKNRTENDQKINHADHKKTEWANGNDMDPSTNSAENGNTKNVGSPLKL